MRDDTRTRLRKPRLSRSEWSRRELILSGVLGGSALLAGCTSDDPDDDDTAPGDDDDDDTTTPEDIDGVHVEGQTLRIPFFSNPAEVSTLWDFTGIGTDTVYEVDHNVYRATHEVGAWGRWWSALYAGDIGPTFPQLYESIDIGVDTITVKIRDDAYWSDGQPVRALDALTRRSPFVTAFPAGDPDPDIGFNPTPDDTTITGAINHYELPDGDDGKVWEWHIQDTPEWNEIGGFESFQQSVLMWLAGNDPRIGTKLPSHVEPYKTMLEVSREYWDDRDLDKPLAADLAWDTVTEDDVMRLREGDEYVSHGAWTLDEILGTTEIVLTKNEYHRYADDINFDEVILEYSEEQSRTEAQLIAGAFDYANVNAPPETAQAFPDTHEEFVSPAASGLTISIDHSSIYGTDPRLRQAIMYAIHTPDVAQNHHPTAAEPIITPGWDNWASEGVMTEDWALDNLFSYEQDLGRAEDLLHEAGFERNSNDIWEMDGEELQTLLPTQSETPAFEQTVASQLAEFGIILDVQPMDGSVFQDRFHGSDAEPPIEEEHGGSGDFDLWAYGDFPAHQMAGFYNGLSGHWLAGLNNGERMRARNYFDHDLQEAAIEEYTPAPPYWVGGQYWLWEDLTIDIPPIGQPDGTPEPFNPAYTWGAVNWGPLSPMDPQPENPYYDAPHDEPHAENAAYFWQKFAWTANYWLPVLPLVRTMSQHFVNTTNWHWPNELPGDDNEYMWDYFGETYLTFDLPGMNKIVADPDNPKPGANVIGQ